MSSDQGQLKPMDPQLERAEADAVLASETFQRARNLRQILAYVCEQYFSGETRNIKEYNIAVEALGRGADFDPNEDTIVRVEGSRLRRRLREYYATEGAAHAVQLLLPTSGYVPQFVAKQAAAAQFAAPDTEAGTVPGNARAGPEARPAMAEGESEARARPPVYRKWTVLAAAGLTALALAVVFAAWNRQRTADPAVGNAGSVQPGGATRAASTAPLGDETRILCGYTRPDFVDYLGRLWSADRFVQGGSAQESTDDVVGVTDPTLYHSSRVGREFRYDIPLKPGIYELHLLFVETYFGKLQTYNSGEGIRIFSVSINGVVRLPKVDIFADAGGADIPADRIFKDISPAGDGFLHLVFSGLSDWACVSGIEIVPSTPGKMRPVRIVAGGRSYRDQAGQFWGADRCFIGGRPVRHVVPLQVTTDPELYTNSRWGRFSYSIPVAPDSRYQVTLKFAETFYGLGGQGGVGSRMFDVYCNGVALLRNLDIYKEAGGGNRPLDKVFRGVTPNAQGRLVLWFAPVVDYATVSAIEVVDEGK